MDRGAEPSGSAALGTPGVSQPREWAGSSADGTAQQAQLTCPAACTRADFRPKKKEDLGPGCDEAQFSTTRNLSRVGLRTLFRPLHVPHTTSVQPHGWGWGAGAIGKEPLPLPGVCVCLAWPWRRHRRCQGWQALQREHSQGIINNLLSQGGLLGFRITRHGRQEAQMDAPIPAFYIDRDICYAMWGLQPELGAFGHGAVCRTAWLHPDGHCTQQACRARTGAMTSPEYESCHKGIEQEGLGQGHTALIRT